MTMASAYEVDPDALFSDEEEASPAPSPKRARVGPIAPQAPSFGRLNLPSYGTATLSGRSSTAPSTASFSSSSFGCSHSSHAQNNNPYAQVQNGRYSRPKNSYGAPARPPFAKGPPNRPNNFYNRPNQAPRAYAGNDYSATDQPRGPMGRGRGATLPAHVTRNRPQQQQQQPAIMSAREKSITQMASILPEADREKFIQQKLKEKDTSTIVPLQTSGRKRPSGRRRPDERSARKVLANVKTSRVGKFKSLDSLLQASQNSSKRTIQLQGSKHRMHKPEKAHAVYAEATMTKEMIEREERAKIEREREIEEERERVHAHFREMRKREKEERELLSRKWQKVETVAAGMRHSYHLAKVERGLFGEEGDDKRRTLEFWGMTMLPGEDDEKVTELITIHVEEI